MPGHRFEAVIPGRLFINLREAFMSEFARDARRACEGLLDARVTRTEPPGGRRRKSVRAFLEDRSVIVTRRKHRARAELEVVVLRELHARGAGVPRVVAFDGTWMVQEDLGERRLSQALAGAAEAESEKWLGAALDSLARIHQAGRAAGLEVHVPRIGAKSEWLLKLVETPKRLGDFLSLPAPDLPVPELVDRLGFRRPQFIKWDARPGNAATLEDGSVAWFDWEHCGCRNGLEDVAWLLGDEYVPDRAGVEDRLLERFLPVFAGESDPNDSRGYLAIFGTLHMCVRLALILSTKGQGPWWDWEYCLKHDKVAVTAATARKTCLRAARWAGKLAVTEALVPWLEAVSRRLDDIPT